MVESHMDILATFNSLGEGGSQVLVRHDRKPA
jgi:hypothetical protein